MAIFTGQLRSNEIFSALYNMIISQQVFADNIKGTNSKLVDAARVDGSMYGDTKLFYATDVLKSTAWGNDAEATNLLALNRPDAPNVQAIYIDQFRQISLTVDNYLSKRAWGDEGAFSSFNSVMLGWIRDTKRIYDTTLYNAFIGTATSPVATENIEFTLADGKEAESVAEGIADLLTEMTDVSRDFNDYGNLRSYDVGEIKVIWNAQFLNKIKKFDMPTLFHKEGLIDKFDEYSLPARYFGAINSAAKLGDGLTVRSLVEQEIGDNHYFAGDLIDVADTAPAGTSYTVDANIICKVLTKLPPYMSAFEVGTSFFNPKSLTENHYLTFGHNTIEYLKNYPMVSITKAD